MHALTSLMFNIWGLNALPGGVQRLNQHVLFLEMANRPVEAQPMSYCPISASSDRGRNRITVPHPWLGTFNTANFRWTSAVILGYSCPSSHPPTNCLRTFEGGKRISFIRNDWKGKMSNGVKWRDENSLRGTSLKGVDSKKMLRMPGISSPHFFPQNEIPKNVDIASWIIIDRIHLYKRRESFDTWKLSWSATPKKKSNLEDIPLPTIWINTDWGPGQIILVTIYGTQWWRE